mmetsp:Transcript_18629/g.40352  ORF Transcript_18629/g.40352 Transcript_18629/m.40352 type:complete len:89 (+) Transcript_18629:1008-1274(+)
MTVRGTALPALADADKVEVVELPPKRCERGVVEVLWQDFGFDQNAIMDDDATDGLLGASSFARDEGDSVLVLLEHFYQASQEGNRLFL